MVQDDIIIIIISITIDGNEKKLFSILSYALYIDKTLKFSLYTYTSAL